MAHKVEKSSSCWPFSEQKTHMRDGFCTANKIAKVAALLFFGSLLAITLVTLIVKYPTATHIFYSVFSVSAALSLITLAILCVKKNRAGHVKNVAQLDIGSTRITLNTGST